MSIKFEMDIIDPRSACFDHHGTVEHSVAFIAKMSSVQLIEWYIMTGQEPEALQDMEFNHFGHIDDLVALTLIQVADSVEAIQALYRFATSASVLDSCGPAGYGLVSKVIQATVNTCMNAYHSELKALGINSWEASLEQKRAAMEIAAALLAEECSTKTCTPASVELLPLDGEAADVMYIDVDGLSVCAVDIQSTDINIFRHAAWLYSQGADVVVSHNNGKFSILAASNYSTDLSGLWDRLSSVEENGTWGGHAGAGGSPRDEQSSLDAKEVLAITADFLRQ